MRFSIIVFIFCIPTIVSAQIDSVSTRIGSNNPANVTMTQPDKGKTDEKTDKTYSISITVTNIRNRDGVIRFKFYDDTTPFPDLKGFLKVVVPKSEMVGDSLIMTLQGFKSQRMAIALLDDENNNVKLDFGWFLPKEGHAFSDYYHAALRRPVYGDFNFLLISDKKVFMKMKYY